MAVEVFEVDPKFTPPVAIAGVDTAAVFPKENTPPLGAAVVAAGEDPRVRVEPLKADQIRGLHITHTYTKKPRMHFKI